MWVPGRLHLLPLRCRLLLHIHQFLPVEAKVSDQFKKCVAHDIESAGIGYWQTGGSNWNNPLRKKKKSGWCNVSNCWCDSACRLQVENHCLTLQLHSVCSWSHYRSVYVLDEQICKVRVVCVHVSKVYLSRLFSCGWNPSNYLPLSCWIHWEPI